MLSFRYLESIGHRFVKKSVTLLHAFETITIYGAPVFSLLVVENLKRHLSNYDFFCVYLSMLTGGDRQPFDMIYQNVIFYSPREADLYNPRPGFDRYDFITIGSPFKAYSIINYGPHTSVLSMALSGFGKGRSPVAHFFYTLRNHLKRDRRSCEIRNNPVEMRYGHSAGTLSPIRWSPSSPSDFECIPVQDGGYDPWFVKRWEDRWWETIGWRNASEGVTNLWMYVSLPNSAFRVDDWVLYGREFVCYQTWEGTKKKVAVKMIKAGKDFDSSGHFRMGDWHYKWIIVSLMHQQEYANVYYGAYDGVSGLFLSTRRKPRNRRGNG
jgi:hypothetical protein